MHRNYETEVLDSRLPCLWLETRGHFAILWFAAASVACCSSHCNDYRCIHSRLCGTSASCLAPPSVYCSFESQAGCSFTFHFIQPAIRIVRMLCCMRYVVLVSKASMTVTWKSLNIRGLKHNICTYIKPHLVVHSVSYKDLRTMCVV